MRRLVLAGVMGVVACGRPSPHAPEPRTAPPSTRSARSLVLVTAGLSSLGDRASPHSLAAAYIDGTPVFFSCDSDDAGYGSVGIVPERLTISLEGPSERAINCAGKCEGTVDAHVLARRWAFRTLSRKELKGACSSAQYSVIRIDYGSAGASTEDLPTSRPKAIGESALNGLTPLRVFLAPIQAHSESWALETIYPCEAPLVLRSAACRVGRASPFACRPNDSQGLCEDQCAANDLLSCFNTGLRVGVNSDDGRKYMRKACAGDPLLCKYALIPRIGSADPSELVELTGLAQTACAHGLGSGCQFLVYARKPVAFSASDGTLIRACEAGAASACYDLADAQIAAGDRERALVSYHRACQPGAEQACSRYAALRAAIGG